MSIYNTTKLGYFNDAVGHLGDTMKNRRWIKVYVFFDDATLSRKAMMAKLKKLGLDIEYSDEGTTLDEDDAGTSA